MLSWAKGSSAVDLETINGPHARPQCRDVEFVKQSQSQHHLQHASLSTVAPTDLEMRKEVLWIGQLDSRAGQGRDD